MLYGFLIKMNNSWFQSIIKPDLKGILGKQHREEHRDVFDPICYLATL